MDYMDLIREELNAPETGPLLSDLISPGEEIREGENSLTEKDIQTVESILRSGRVGYAYQYQQSSEIPQISVFSQTPENIANFLGQQLGKNTETILTDRLDVTVLTAFGGFIDQCRDQKTLQSVLQYLVPIQGEKVSPKEVPTVSMDTMKLYHDTMEMVRSEMRMEM
jgi:hypothetical protein